MIECSCHSTESRIEEALRDVGRQHEPDPDWQAKTWARIERQRQPRWPARALDAAMRWLLRVIG